MPPTGTTLPQVIDDCHELLKWLIPLLDQFPRARRASPWGSAWNPACWPCLKSVLTPPTASTSAPNSAPPTGAWPSPPVVLSGRFHGNGQHGRRVSMSLLPGRTEKPGQIVLQGVVC